MGDPTLSALYVSGAHDFSGVSGISVLTSGTNVIVSGTNIVVSGISLLASGTNIMVSGLEELVSYGVGIKDGSSVVIHNPAGDPLGSASFPCLPMKQSFCIEDSQFKYDISATTGAGSCAASSDCNPWMDFWLDTIHSPTIRSASCTPEVIPDVGPDDGDEKNLGDSHRGSDGGPGGGGIDPIGKTIFGESALQGGGQDSPDWGEGANDRAGGYNLTKASAATRGGSEYLLEWHAGATSGTVHDIPFEEWYCFHSAGTDEQLDIAFNHNLQPIVAPRKAGGVWVAGKEAIAKTAFIRLDRPESVNPSMGWLPSGTDNFNSPSFSSTIRQTNDPFDIRPAENTGYGWSWFDLIAIPKTVSGTTPLPAGGINWDFVKGFGVGDGDATYPNMSLGTGTGGVPYVWVSSVDDWTTFFSGGGGLHEVSSVIGDLSAVKDFSSCWAVASSVTETAAGAALETNTEYLLTVDVSCINAGSSVDGVDYSGALFVWGGTSAVAEPYNIAAYANGLRAWHRLQSPYPIVKARNVLGDFDSDWEQLNNWNDLGTVSATFKTDPSSTHLVIGWRGVKDLSQGILNTNKDVWALRNVAIYKKHYSTCKRVVLHGINMDSAGNLILKTDHNNVTPGESRGTMTVYDGSYPTNHGWDPHWAGWAGVAFSSTASGTQPSALQAYGNTNVAQYESNVHAEYRHHGSVMGMSRQTTFDPPVPCHPGYPVRIMCTEEWDDDFSPNVDGEPVGTDTWVDPRVRPSDVYWNGTITYSIESLKDGTAPGITVDWRNPTQDGSKNTDKCT
jgi:hypothetical protein